MKIQKAAVVKPIMGPDPSLDLTQIQPLLSEGWTVAATETSTNCAILVILEKDDGAGSNGGPG